jgi:hypothetical protein
MKKKIIKKILTSKKARKATVLGAFIVAAASAGDPWSI